MSEYKNALKLNNFEVIISMIKFTLGIGVFTRPFLYMKYGILNSMLCDILATWIAVASNTNLVKCM